MRCGMHCITSCMELWSCLSLYLPLARRCWTVTWMYVLHATLGAVGCFWCSSPPRAQVLVFTALSMSPLENALATGPRLARVQAVTLNNGVTSGRRTSVDFYVSTWDEQPPNSDANAEDWVGKEMDRRGLRPLGSVDDEYGRRRLATAVSRGDIPWADGDVAGLAGPHGERSAAAEMYTEALYLFPDGVSLSYVHPCERPVCLVLTLTFPMLAATTRHLVENSFRSWVEPGISSDLRPASGTHSQLRGRHCVTRSCDRMGSRSTPICSYLCERDDGVPCRSHPHHVVQVRVSPHAREAVRGLR